MGWKLPRSGLYFRPRRGSVRRRTRHWIAHCPTASLPSIAHVTTPTADRTLLLRGRRANPRTAAAAKELNVTPAAISHQVKALEKYLGVDLFVHHHRRVSLTQAARVALPELHEGFQALGRAVDKIRAYGEERLIVTVCAEPLFATKWIVPRLHRFYARCPDAEVRLQASVHTVDRLRDSAFGVTDLKRAGIDVSVRLGYGQYTGVESQRLMGLELVPMCTPELAATVDDVDALLRAAVAVRQYPYPLRRTLRLERVVQAAGM
ncbi:MAG: LysR family transcriptional regulator [Halomonas sp.]|uniref:LysR family transcriptional regulator n=1 Tax=Halomonas sp. TaxID=1486246 RepID=UPI002ACD4083|nr:LysR family transcriptional regulator [Halomonas sp.]MDZ7853204.1 LysR family transcriptional regulator [Halomonas sp.]